MRRATATICPPMRSLTVEDARALRELVHATARRLGLERRGEGTREDTVNFLLLAQTLISQGTSFTVPILVLLLGLAGALAEARWRVGQAERHADKQDEKVQRLEARLAAVEVQQASHGVVQGEVKALLTEVRDELRSKSRVA